MNLSQLLLILRARRKVALLTLLATVVITVVVSLVMPPTYKATTSLVMNYKGIDPVTGLGMPGQLLPGYMATQIDIITSKSVALRVVDTLKLASSPAVIEQFNDDTGGKGTIRDWLADLLLKKLNIVPSRESSVVDITFKGADPDFVAAVANAFADEYLKLNVQLKVDPMRRATAYFNNQIKLQRDALEASQSRLSKYQQEHGIVSVDNRLDVEQNRLNDLSAQLVAAQAAQVEAASRQRMAAGGSAESPDVAANPLIQNLKMNLGIAEGKLAEIGQRLDRNHPQYLSAKAEVDKLRAELREQLNNTASSIGGNAQILRQREAAIRTALNEQKARLLELNRTRDEMGVLSKELENAQRAYDATAQRLSQTKIEGQADQTDIAVLNPAVPPIDPSSPKLLLNSALSIIMGVILAVTVAVFSELTDRRVRSAGDLASMVKVPVLGVLDCKPPAKRRFGLKGRRALQHKLIAN